MAIFITPLIMVREGKSQVLKYRPETNINFTLQSQTEIIGPGKIKGDTLFNANSLSLFSFSLIFGIGQDNWAGINQKWRSGTSGTLMATFNENGDTLCSFSDYDRIVNFTKPNYRKPVKFMSYLYDGLLTIKQEYNDTVFRLIPPNRLLPAYILSFGEYKVTYTEGINPDIDLSGKYLLKSLQETNDFLFISYTENNDSPANKIKNSVRYHNVIFDKKQGKIYHQPGIGQKPYSIKNDLDGGMYFLA